MKKKFWKIEYSITTFFIFGIILLLIPSKFIASKEALYISKWNETFKKMEYVFNAMTAQADTEILKSFKKAQTNEAREQLMIKLVKPYMRISEYDLLTKKYSTNYMNGNKVKSDDKFYFEKVYLTKNGTIVGVKDIKDNDIFHPGFIMMFDLNGLAGPNVWGKDVYGISIYSDGRIKPIGSDWTLEDLKKDCSPAGTGVSCSHYYRIGGEFNE